MRALPTVVLAVFLSAPTGWHFTRTGQERVTDVNGKALSLKLVRGEWKVAVPAAQTFRYQLFLCREKGSRVCSRVQGEVGGTGWERAVVREPTGPAASQ